MPSNFDEKHIKTDAGRASGKGASNSTQGADHSGNPQGRQTPARDGFVPLYGRNADLEATTIRAKSKEIIKRIQAGEEILDDWQGMICDTEYVRREEKHGHPDTIGRPKGSTICRYHAVGRTCKNYDACHFAHTAWPEEIKERMTKMRAQERAQRDQDRENRSQGSTTNYQPLPRREVLLPPPRRDVSIAHVGYENRQTLPGVYTPGWSDTSPVYPATHHLGSRTPQIPPPPSLPPLPPPTDTSTEGTTTRGERLLPATPKQPPQGGQQYYQAFNTQHRGEQQTTAAQPQQHNIQQNTWAGAPQQARQHQEPMSSAEEMRHIERVSSAQSGGGIWNNSGS